MPEENEKSAQDAGAWEKAHKPLLLTAIRIYGTFDQAASMAKPKYLKWANRLLWLLLIPPLMTTLSVVTLLKDLCQENLRIQPFFVFGGIGLTVQIALAIIGDQIAMLSKDWFGLRERANEVRRAARQLRLGLITKHSFLDGIRPLQELLDTNGLPDWEGDPDQKLPLSWAFTSDDKQHPDTGLNPLSLEAYVAMMRKKRGYHLRDVKNESARIKRYEQILKLMRYIAVPLGSFPAIGSLLNTISTVVRGHLANIRLHESLARNIEAVKNFGVLLHRWEFSRDQVMADPKKFMAEGEMAWRTEERQFTAGRGQEGDSFLKHSGEK